LHILERQFRILTVQQFDVGFEAKVGVKFEKIPAEQSGTIIDKIPERIARILVGYQYKDE
jgi:hypothetical protein